MPTLLQINSSANASSHGKIAESIGRLALEQGWRSIIAYGRRVNPSQSELIRIGSDFALKEHGLETRLLDNHGLASRKATCDFLKEVDKIAPDLIHLHNIHGYYLNYRLLFEYLQTTNIPVVWTLHDCWTFTGHCAHFVTVGCEKWKTGCYDCPLKGDYPKSFVDRSERNYELKKKLFTSISNLHIVTVSDWLAGLVGQSFFRGKDIRVIKNGVDLNVFKPIKSNSQSTKYRILGVSGVWTKEKGLYDIFQLRGILDREKFDIILVGVNEKQVASLPEGIIGIQRTESVEELRNLYSSVDVLINPTYADTFPTVNLEALACGTPVVTYRTGGSPEAINENTGIVVEKGDVNALAEAIIKISQKGHDKLLADCRLRAEQMFDKNKRYKDYMDVYQEIRGGKFLILGVASVWLEDKGLLDYYKLGKMLKDDELLVLVGVSKEMQEKLPAPIIGIPRTESLNELVCWYNVADVVLSLSKAETFGITIAEGMACGTPAIVYDNTAQPELITRETGFVAKNGDVEDIYNYIQKIKEKGQNYYFNASLQHAREKFDSNIGLHEYIDLYNSIL